MSRIQYEGRFGRFPRNDLPARFDGASYAEALASIRPEPEVASVVFSSMTAPAPVYVTEPAKAPRNRRKLGTPRLTAADIYGPLMRGQGFLTAARLSQLSGRKVGAVNDALSKTLLPEGKVQRKRVGASKQWSFQWKWIAA